MTESNPSTEPTQDPEAPAPSDPATPDDPDNGDPHAEPAPDVQVNADEADVTVNGEADDGGE